MESMNILRCSGSMSGYIPWPRLAIHRSRPNCCTSDCVDATMSSCVCVWVWGVGGGGGGSECVGWVFVCVGAWEGGSQDIFGSPERHTGHRGQGSLAE